MKHLCPLTDRNLVSDPILRSGNSSKLIAKEAEISPLTKVLSNCISAAASVPPQLTCTVRQNLRVDRYVREINMKYPNMIDSIGPKSTNRSECTRIEFAQSAIRSHLSERQNCVCAIPDPTASGQSARIKPSYLVRDWKGAILAIVPYNSRRHRDRILPRSIDGENSLRSILERARISEKFSRTLLQKLGNIFVQPARSIQGRKGTNIDHQYTLNGTRQFFQPNHAIFPFIPDEQFTRRGLHYFHLSCRAAHLNARFQAFCRKVPEEWREIDPTMRECGQLEVEGPLNYDFHVHEGFKLRLAPGTRPVRSGVRI